MIAYPKILEDLDGADRETVSRSADPLLIAGIQIGARAGMDALSVAYTQLTQLPDTRRQLGQRLAVACAAAELAENCGISIPDWAQKESDNRGVKLENR